MPTANVSEYLERARECAKLAEKKSGEEKKRIMQIAQAWLSMAQEAALQAEKSRAMKNPSANSPHYQ